MSTPPLRLSRLVAVPSIIAGIAAALLAVISTWTEEPIRTALQERTAAALVEVMPPFTNQPAEESIQIGEVTFYIGRHNGEISGFAGETVTTRGYAGPITVLAGLDPDGTITTVLVTRQSETPGLGSEVCERSRQKTLSGLLSGQQETGLPPNPVLDQFSGRRAESGQSPWTVRQDGGTIDAMTGATITSRAVTEATFTIAETFASHRDTLP